MPLISVPVLFISVVVVVAAGIAAGAAVLPAAPAGAALFMSVMLVALAVLAFIDATSFWATAGVAASSAAAAIDREIVVRM